MANPWFKPAGWLFRPISWQGYLAVGCAAAFCVQTFMAVDRHSHSVSDTLYGVFPYFVPAFLLLNWVASKRGA